MGVPVTRLTDWLTACADEDAANSWAVHDVAKCDAMLYEENMAVWAARAGPDCDCGYPAQVLREVEFKRAILELAALGTWPRGALQRVLFQALAEVYKDHPGYQEAISGTG